MCGKSYCHKIDLWRLGKLNHFIIRFWNNYSGYNNRTSQSYLLFLTESEFLFLCLRMTFVIDFYIQFM